MLKVNITWKPRLNSDGEPMRFSLICTFWLHDWANSGDKNRWAVWRCARCNKIKYILGSAKK